MEGLIAEIGWFGLMIRSVNSLLEDLFCIQIKLIQPLRFMFIVSEFGCEFCGRKMVIYLLSSSAKLESL